MRLLDLVEPAISLIKEKIDALNLSDRDRRALGWGLLGAAVIVVIIIFQSVSSHIGSLEKRSETLSKDISEIRVLNKQFVESARKMEAIRKAIITPESLLSSVESILLGANINRGSFSIKSRPTALFDLYEEINVQVDINKIPLSRIVDVMYKVQSTQTFLKISKIKINTRFDSPDLMDLSFRVSTYKFEKVI